MPPVYDFVSDDGIGHTVWVIDSDTEIGMLVQSFANVENFYIADGHHRNASAVKVGLKRREQKPDYTGDEEFNYYLPYCSLRMNSLFWITTVWSKT